MKADILALVQALSLGQADSTLAEAYYYEILNELGEREILVTTTLLEVPIETISTPIGIPPGGGSGPGGGEVFVIGDEHVIDASGQEVVVTANVVSNGVQVVDHTNQEVVL